MGYGYNYACKKCGCEYSDVTGEGMLYPGDYAEVVREARNGNMVKSGKNL